jgi:hypothetical protein
MLARGLKFSKLQKMYTTTQEFQMALASEKITIQSEIIL